jgi:hypothetical protein
LKRFAQALEPNRRKEEKCKTSLVATTILLNFIQSRLSSVSTTKKTKKREGKYFPLVSPYGRFLRTKMMTVPTTTIAMIIPMIPGTKYRSATEAACVGCGVGVAAASSTTKAV